MNSDFDRLREIVSGEVDWEPDVEKARINALQAKAEQAARDLTILLHKVQDERDELRRVERAARRVVKDMGPTNMNALRQALEGTSDE